MIDHPSVHQYKHRSRHFIEWRGNYPIEVKANEMLVFAKTGQILCAPSEDFVFIAKKPGSYIIVDRLIPHVRKDIDKPEFGL